MSWYFFTQATPTSKWDIHLASERERIIRENKPELVTVLDCDADFSRDMSLEEVHSVKYQGPAYFDFDGADEDFSIVISQYQKFLNKLVERNVDLNMVRLFASGGRGFHVEIPLTMLAGKVPPTGIQGLPHILKEVAHQLYVDTLDLRVYSAKKGRMWRCPNVLRANKKYKVPITAEEAMVMTPELYEQVCSSPRSLPNLEPAVFNPQLGLLYSQAKDRIEAAAKKVKARKKTSDEAQRFKGEWPATVKALMAGTAIKDGVGWNRIAMQLAMTADALGKTEEQLLTDAAPLIETYQGDSDRYGTQRKRRLHLQEMFRYLAGNITYTFNVGGLIALCNKDQDISDLTNGEYCPDPEEAAKDEGSSEDAPKDEDGEAGDAEDTTYAVRLNKYGIFARTDEGWKRASSLGFGTPFLLVENDGKSVGYDVEVFIDGESRGRHILPAQQLSSKAQLNAFGLSWSASVNTSDSQTSQIADVLRHKVKQRDAVTYVVNREGVDLIMPHGAKSESDAELVWSSPLGVIAPSGTRYRFSSRLDRDGAYASDLMNAPELENTEEDAALVNALLNLNNPLNVARILGWFSAAFMCQPVRHVSGNKFPMLQVFGMAEAGKSRTVSWYNHLHYYLQEPKEMMSVAGTAYPALVACASSASMPVVFEEMKTMEMSKSRKDFLKALFRSAYDGHDMERGGLSKDAGPKEIVVNKFKLAGPVAFVGEAIEDQSAIIDRCITVAMNKDHRKGREQHDALLERRCAEIGKIGRAMALRCLTLDLAKLRSEVFSQREAIIARMSAGKDQTTRLSKAVAIPLLGLELLRGTLAKVFGTRFDEKITELRETILSNLDTMLPNNMSEAAKVLDVMAQLTRTLEVNHRLEKGIDYLVSDDGLTTELNVKQAFTKYVKYMRSMGMEPLYASESVFIAGLANYGGVVAKACPGSPLWRNARQVIYRLSNAHLDGEAIEPFEP